MIPVEESRRSGAHARYKLAALAAAAMIGLWGCEGVGVGVSYSAAGYYGPYDYDYDYYDYGPWGPGYDVGPPLVVGGVVVHDHGHDHDHGGDHGRPPPHYRAPAPASHMPSIPSGSRPR